MVNKTFVQMQEKNLKRLHLTYMGNSHDDGRLGKHPDEILSSEGENLLTGKGTVSSPQDMKKAQVEYRKYKAKMLSSVEKDYLDSLKLLGQKGK